MKKNNKLTFSIRLPLVIPALVFCFTRAFCGQEVTVNLKGSVASECFVQFDQESKTKAKSDEGKSLSINNDVLKLDLGQIKSACNLADSFFMHVSSENGGKLVHDKGRSYRQYSMSLGQFHFGDLSRPSQIVLPRHKATRRQIMLELGEKLAKMLPPGQYADTITIRIGEGDRDIVVMKLEIYANETKKTSS